MASIDDPTFCLSNEFPMHRLRNDIALPRLRNDLDTPAASIAVFTAITCSSASIDEFKASGRKLFAKRKPLTMLTIRMNGNFHTEIVFEEMKGTRQHHRSFSEILLTVAAKALPSLLSRWHERQKTHTLLVAHDGALNLH